MAEVSLAFFFKLPMVGMAMSMRIRMMAMTISSSISVKPLDCLPSGAPRRPRQSENLRFMEFQCLLERAGDAQPIRQNATSYRRGREMERSEKEGTGNRE